MVGGVACRASGTGFPALSKCFSSQVKGGEENVENFFFSNCSVSDRTKITIVVLPGAITDVMSKV